MTAPRPGAVPAGPAARGWRPLLRAYRVLLSFSFEAGRWQTVAFLALAALQQLVYLAATYGWKLLVDAVLGGSGAGVLLAALVWAGAHGLGELCQRGIIRLSVALNERVGLALDRRLMGLLGGLPGLAHHERPEYLDEVALLRAQRGRLAGLTDATAMVVRQWTALLGSAVLLARLDPLLLLLPLFGLGSIWTGRQAHRVLRRTEEATAEPGRLRRRLFATATSAAAGKELRVFGLTEELVARHRALAEAMARESLRGAWQRQLLELGGSLLFVAGYIGAVAVVLLRAVQGRATPGDVVLAIGLAGRLHTALAGVLETGNTLRESATTATRYLWLADEAARAGRAAAAAAAPPAPLPRRLTEGLVLERVAFGYPGTDAAVLADVSLRLPAGAVVALVGENGAGKTTLVKLLCRFYEPAAGRILVDGVDLRRVEVGAWRARLSAGFQDFARFEFLVRETVGFGDLPRIADPGAVGRALARAGAGALPGALPAGLETQLGTAWEGGVDLSGGQWQQLALARTLLREAPLLTVFDEPTAALDAPTEHALFERIAAAARSGGARGAVTVLVSHRFSTVRTADLIVVLDGGRVRETGSHAELVARGGLYAELYELQARAYRDPAPGPGSVASAAPPSDARLDRHGGGATTGDENARPLRYRVRAGGG